VSGRCGEALGEKRPVKLLADFWTLSRAGSPYAPFWQLPKPPGASLSPELSLVPAPFSEFKTEGPSSAVEKLPARLVKALWSSDTRRLYENLVHCDLRLAGVDGFEKAEVTLGGLALKDLDWRTMESRRQRGLFFCGEAVNVTGRLGGFNFQWAWASGFLAGRGARG